MLQTSGEISIANIQNELSGSSGSQQSLSSILDSFNSHGTNVSIPDYTYERGYGYAGGTAGGNGGDIWHYLYVDNVWDYGTYVNCQVWNNAVGTSQSATLYYEIYDSSDTLLTSGSRATGAINAQSSASFNLSYSGGTASYVRWGWSASYINNDSYI